MILQFKYGDFFICYYHCHGCIVNPTELHTYAACTVEQHKKLNDSIQKLHFSGNQPMQTPNLLQFYESVTPYVPL